jgi:hypothetical protein
MPVVASQGGGALQITAMTGPDPGAQTARQHSSPAPAPGSSVIVHWDSAAPALLIAAVEARLAAGTRFAVLAAVPPLGRGEDHALLARWWSAVHGRLAGRCTGWAVLVPGADIDPALLARHAVRDSAFQFPIRACADRAEALRWLRVRLMEASATSPHAAAPRWPGAAARP